MKEGKIYGVSLGPGDPELITLKGLRILKDADKIYYPGSLLEDGSNTSYALNILKHYNLNENKLEGMFLKMSDDRQQALSTYNETFLKIKKEYRQGLKIAVVSEGDILFYSTFAYLLQPIQEHDLKLEIISGIPSFIMGAGEHKIPIAVLEDKIAILPRIRSKKDLEKYIEEFQTVVLIKIRSVMQEITEVIEAKHLKILYCERLGTEQQYTTTLLHEIKHREIPYFSLLIIKK